MVSNLGLQFAPSKMFRSQDAEKGMERSQQTAKQGQSQKARDVTPGVVFRLGVEVSHELSSKVGTKTWNPGVEGKKGLGAPGNVWSVPHLENDELSLERGF